MRASAYRFGHGKDMVEAYAVGRLDGPWAIRAMGSNVHRRRSDPRSPRSWGYVHSPASDGDAQWTREEAIEECLQSADEELIREVMDR